jgi:hypothetical protein
MATDRTTKLALDPGNILDVVDVSVCKEQKFEIDTKRTHPFASTLRRVEENHPFWRLNEITIRFENTATKTLVIHCDLLYPSAITAEGESFYELLNVHPFRLSDPYSHGHAVSSSCVSCRNLPRWETA